MTRKLVGVFTAVTAALLFVGVAWAGTDSAALSETSSETSVTTSTEDTSMTVDDDNEASSTTVTNIATDEKRTKTSVDDDEENDQEDTDDRDDDVDADSNDTDDRDDDVDADSNNTNDRDDDTDDRDDDSDDGIEIAVSGDLGLRTFTVAGVGEVMIEVTEEGLSLVSVDAPGWQIEVEKAEDDRIEVEFYKGDSEAEFEVELEHGSINVEIESG